MNDAITGSCLCQGVQYQISSHKNIFQYCHCSRCRKFTGSAFAANLFVAPDDFQWLLGEDLVVRYEPKFTKHLATAFCSRCGSSMPWLAKTGKVVVVPAGSLDQSPGLKPMQNIFWDSHADWFVEPGTLPKHAKLPVKK